ncbi:YdbH family protein [Erwinia sp. CPCC 100877]|nr:YdbH family protein [Erwinia sp. CPCC 100877]
MKGKYKALLALLLLFILLPLTLMLTVAYWLPTLAGIWLPQGTRIAITSGPRIRQGALILPDLRYLAGECELANLKSAALRHPGSWSLKVGELTLNPDCFSQIPSGDNSSGTTRTLAGWQQMLPDSSVSIKRLTLSSVPQYSGTLQLEMTSRRQQLSFNGDLVTLNAVLSGRDLTVKQFEFRPLSGMEPARLTGEVKLALMPDGLPTRGHMKANMTLPQEPRHATAELAWESNRGQLLIGSHDLAEPLLDLPWELSHDRLKISDGRWLWPWAGFPLSGRLALQVDNWQKGLEQAQITARVSVLTKGEAGKGNAVLTLGPGRLSMTASSLPLRLTGEAKQDKMIFYAMLPGKLSGPLLDPTLHFLPGALLRSRGQVIDSLNIDEVRWPLAGVKLTRNGVDGRLQAILRAHENKMGNFTLHLDGKAHDFLPDKGRWAWRYWGDGRFSPMRARWDVKGKGEWRDSVIRLTELSTGFDQLQYGSMTVHQPRLILVKPLVWQRNPQQPDFRGALALHAAGTRFANGSELPPAVLNFALKGKEPTAFLYRGDLTAGDIGPVRVHGRWDGERLRGEAWWPRQSLSVFQPLLPPDWKLTLKSGELYAQVAFSAAADQGFVAGGHGVLKGGDAWLSDSKINGVDFVLPFRYSDATWHLGTRGPVRLRIEEIESQAVARKLTADLQGWYPWSEERPLLLSDVSVDLLGGSLLMKQLRMPQRDPALLRLHNISSSELVSAVNPRQLALSGRIEGALPIWFNHPQWIVKDGWVTARGPLTLRLDKDMADAIVRDNVTAGAAINWLRYIEISHSWTTINLDNLGVLTMISNLEGTGRVNGKNGTVKLNYSHQENLFMLWRSLRFGDNLQSWLEQNMSLPDARCAGQNCKEQE